MLTTIFTHVHENNKSIFLLLLNIKPNRNKNPSWAKSFSYVPMTPSIIPRHNKAKEIRIRFPREFNNVIPVLSCAQNRPARADAVEDSPLRSSSSVG